MKCIVHDLDEPRKLAPLDLVAKFLDAASSMNMGASTNTLQLETAHW